MKKKAHSSALRSPRVIARLMHECQLEDELSTRTTEKDVAPLSRLVQRSRLLSGCSSTLGSRSERCAHTHVHTGWHPRRLHTRPIAVSGQPVVSHGAVRLCEVYFARRPPVIVSFPTLHQINENALCAATRRNPSSVAWVK